MNNQISDELHAVATIALIREALELLAPIRGAMELIAHVNAMPHDVWLDARVAFLKNYKETNQ